MFVGSMGDVSWRVRIAVDLLDGTLTYRYVYMYIRLFVFGKRQSIFTVGFWTAGLPAIMNPDNNLAVDSYAGGVSNFNLYFFSWGAFLLSFMVFFDCVSIPFIEAPMADDQHATERRCSRTSWAGLMATSFVVMVASSRLYQDLDCDMDVPTSNGSSILTDLDANCDRTKFAVALGTVSATTGLVWLVATIFLLKGPLGSKVDFGLVWLLLIFWTCGVVFLTFDQTKSPGRNLGNLYFFTWGSWALNVFMAMASLQNVMASSCHGMSHDGASNDDKPAPDVAPADVETPTGDELSA
jgi:hypothetical protein